MLQLGSFPPLDLTLPHFFLFVPQACLDSRQKDSQSSRRAAFTAELGAALVETRKTLAVVGEGVAHPNP